MEGGPLRVIREQLADEVGENWESDEEVLRGRNAVRGEHGLPPIGETRNERASATPRRRPLWRRMLGR